MEQFNSKSGLALSRAVNHRLLNVEDRVRSQTVPRGICGRQGRSWKGFPSLVIIPLIPLLVYQSLWRRMPVRTAASNFVGYLIFVFRHFVGILGWKISCHKTCVKQYCTNTVLKQRKAALRALYVKGTRLYKHYGRELSWPINISLLLSLKAQRRVQIPQLLPILSQLNRCHLHEVLP
jgi:hypothetical protein